jgi:DNA-3-methyladenine glycosylase
LKKSTEDDNPTRKVFISRQNMIDHITNPDYLTILGSDYYLRDAILVAPDLLGKVLVRKFGTTWMGGMITETEAYQGEEDLGCHAKAGLTSRTQVMYGPPGHAYVYFTYGMHWMLNAVTSPKGTPAAVLIRSIQPLFGKETMQRFRPLEKIKLKEWTNGPAKLCQALDIQGKLNGIDLCNQSGELWIGESGISVKPGSVVTSARIGLNSVPEPWKSISWRWYVKEE